jgi:hypothetical protein
MAMLLCVAMLPHDTVLVSVPPEGALGGGDGSPAEAYSPDDWHQFSKVSSVVSYMVKYTRALTFENFCQARGPAHGAGSPQDSAERGGD